LTPPTGASWKSVEPSRTYPAGRAVVDGRKSSDVGTRPSPCGPIGPTGPTGPTEPVAPWIPCGPGSPCGPVGPAGPAGSADPDRVPNCPLTLTPTIDPEASGVAATPARYALVWVLPMRMTWLSLVVPSLPMKILPVPVAGADRPARYPRAIFQLPVVLFWRASIPCAVLFEPVELDSSA
jgi:hypothetical protein